MSADRIRSMATLAIGLGLIAFGVLFLAGTILQIDIWGTLWPLFIVIPGLLFFVGMIVLGRPGAPLAVPGSIITMAGVILFIQNLTGLWSTWAYAWTLIAPTAVGIGVAIAGMWNEDQKAVRVGSALAGIGIAIFFFLVILFELILNLNGLRSGPVGRIALPVLVIAAGVGVLAWAFLPRKHLR